MFETLTLEFTGQLATLTLNRPDKRNAINAKMVSEMQSALDDIETGHARVAIITGAGKSFCAGMDLEMLSDIASQSSAENMDDSRRMGKMFRRIWSFSKPLIAAVNGAALAGGCGIATLCDFFACAGSEIWLHGSEDRILACHRLCFSDAANWRQTGAQFASDWPTG
jgi:methylglutaconyl-CoA hydratase